MKMKDINNNMIKEIVRTYLNSNSMSEVKDYYEGIYDLSTDNISKALHKAIRECIVDDHSANAIIRKALENSESMYGDKLLKRRKFYEGLLLERSIYKEEMKAIYRKKRISKLKQEIETYDEIFSAADEAPSKEELEAELEFLLIEQQNQVTN